jgi:transcriptional regulator, AraC family
MLSIIDYLTRETDIETRQKETGKHIPDYDNQNADLPRLTNDLFLANRSIYISKHNRYAPYPKHTHQFLELNYVLQGQCQQIINDTPYTFYEGDILLMDAGSAHAIEALGEDDLLINIVFKDTQISLKNLEELQGQNSILYQFLLKSHTHIQSAENFIVLQSDKTNKSKNLIELMLNEYFDPKPFSNQILEHYLSILLFELARSLPTLGDTVRDANDPYVQVLELIDQEYSTLTLAKAAKELNFNKNYLSNLIKEKGNVTFTELLNQKKIMIAQLLLKSTNFSIEKICQTVGYSNKTYFYKQFQNQFGKLPSQVRNTKELS